MCSAGEYTDRKVPSSHRSSFFYDPRIFYFRTIVREKLPPLLVPSLIFYVIDYPGTGGVVHYSRLVFFGDER